MLIDGSTFVSDCHEAVIYMEGTEYHCMQCMQRCKSAGTLGEVTERRNAIPNERARLEREVVGKATAFGKAWKCRIQDRVSSRYPSEQVDAQATEARIQLCDAVDALLEFEENQKGDR